MNEPSIMNPHAQREINLLHLHKYLDRKSNYRFLEYIHTSRSPEYRDNFLQLGGDYEKEMKIQNDDYYKCLPCCLSKISEYFKHNKNSYDAIVYAPSCTNMHLPFFVEIVKVIEFSTIISFSKSKSAGVSSDFDDYYEHFNLEMPVAHIKKNLEKYAWDDVEIEKLLIVDDMYADGKTVGAIIKRLTDLGNEIKLDEIDVFTPLIT